MKGSRNLGFGTSAYRLSRRVGFICKLINLAITTRVEEWVAKGRPKRGKTPHSHKPDSHMLGLPD